METVLIQQAEMLEALNRSEVDMQITTAKRYPRVLTEVLNKIGTYATMDAETAGDCFYALRRGGTAIDGLSVRLAEIIASAWGNLRVQTRIIGNDGKTITAQGVCHDLETNNAVSVEVKRRITDKQGRTFSDDMQVVTGNAAAAIAFRNAVLKVVPKAITKRVIDDIRQVALGKSVDVETGRRNALANFKKAGVTERQVLDYLEVSGVEDIDKERLFLLRAVWNAIKEGSATVEEEFIKPAKEREAAQKASAAEDRVKQAMRGTNADAPTPEAKSAPALSFGDIHKVPNDLKPIELVQ
jgi:hypothetical protein